MLFKLHTVKLHACLVQGARAGVGVTRVAASARENTVASEIRQASTRVPAITVGAPRMHVAAVGLLLAFVHVNAYVRIVQAVALVAEAIKSVVFVLTGCMLPTHFFVSDRAFVNVDTAVAVAD